ncbi:hypothetical protein [Winogradskyella sp. UBA3174]|uniref:hypothetical protein n=1 Tax=Winogradskyella sp. UBA3174 TaxID=1947785 RepID=UPI0025E350CC|nr:hypothetical protein [Winogradskyella sp. UBA3174]|tara:strand:+ start:44062 stop:45033 length:972 start_codon:yes stop_codon:yes gene_type:complete
MRVYDLILIFVALFITSCSSNNDSDASDTTDIRYKVLLDSEGDIVFIGDQTNKVMKKIFAPTNAFNIFGYYNKTETNELFYLTRDDFFSGYKINRVDLNESFNSEEYTYTVQQSDINFDSNDLPLSGAFFESENRFHIMVASSGFDAKLKTFDNGIEVLERNITETFGIDRYSIEAHKFFGNSQTLMLMEGVFNSSLNRIKLIDINTFSLISENTNTSFNFFEGFGNSEVQYLIGRKEINFVVHEYLTDIQGNIIYDITDGYLFLGRSSIGFDEAEGAFEFFDRGDGRNETGTINVTNGELIKRAIDGEPNFRNSPVFYFTPN